MKRWYRGIKIFESKDCFVLKKDIKEWNRIRSSGSVKYDVLWIDKVIKGVNDENDKTR